jgi:hypothetical protein
MDIKKMINDYTEWLRREITIATFSEHTEITTPYVDRFNDYLQIYAKMNSDGTLSLTDDGYIIGNLISSGLTFKKGSKRYNALVSIARKFNVAILNGEEITTSVTPDNFPQAKNMMVQAMLAIDDLFVVSPENVKEMFLEDIETYFNANDIFFTRDFSLLGKTGTVYTYDFHFQRTKNRPERFCRGINRLDMSKRDLALFNWVDTQEKRKDTSELIIIYNDEHPVKDDILRGFTNYGVPVVPFSERQKTENLQLFAA